MHWRGLRILFDGNDSKRQPVDAAPKSRHGEGLPDSPPDITPADTTAPAETIAPTTSNISVPRLPFLSSRHSESSPRLPRLTDPEEEKRFSAPENVAQNRTASSEASSSRPSMDLLGPRRNRFSIWRHRHASDPQLATSYERAEEKVPPVPPLPPRKAIPLLVQLFNVSNG